MRRINGRTTIAPFLSGGGLIQPRASNEIAQPSRVVPIDLHFTEFGEQLSPPI
jgi:hypothetical protein